MKGEQRDRFRSISRDVTSLSDHASFLGAKVSFLLEATLGLISVEQNNIIKIFSVAAVLFLPPTLIASIYGMNFHLLPDIPGRYGNFLFSIGLMIASMGVTYALFKRKGWL
jgi:magnesium transporter